MLTVILVKPRNPLNIGAAARAMANFGLADLRVVCPHPPVWTEAQKTAKGAGGILNKARVFETLPQALEDIDFAFALTSLKNRKTEKQIFLLPRVKQKLEELKGRNLAFIFGPEKTGLCAQDIESANAVLNIPTSSKTPSVNLAQAVILVCYEIAKINSFKKIKKGAKPHPAKKATLAQNKFLLDKTEDFFSNFNFPPTLNKKIRQKRLNAVLQNAALSEKDLFFLVSLLGKMQK